MLLAFLFTILFVIDYVELAPIKNTLEFIILHNNDIHGRFDQIDKDGLECDQKLADDNECYGGFARIAHVIQQFRNESKNGGPPVIYLNAGDTYTGTAWFSIFKDKIASNLMTQLNPDALCLGNHEFDKGISGLIPYFKNVKAPFVGCNIDISNTPNMQTIPNFSKSTILTIDGTQIGIIGYSTQDINKKPKLENLFVTPEVEAFKQEAAKLREQGVKIIIGLGHSGYEIDKQIAAECPDVDLIVGGHSHSFLAPKNYVNEKNFQEKSEGLYPTLIENVNDGKVVPVLQAFAFTKYLGYFKVKFDLITGELIEWNGNPKLLDSTVPQDKNIVDIIDKNYRPTIDELKSNIGNSDIYLDGNYELCREGECSLDDLLADAMVNCANRAKHNVCVGLLHAGIVKGSASIEKGDITVIDIMTITPYNASFTIVKLDGAEILNSLEKSASLYKIPNEAGYLQFSGLKVTFDMKKPIGERVVAASIMDNCSAGTYEELNVDKEYDIVLPTYILNGGDGYTWSNKKKSQSHELNCTDYKAVADYIRVISPIFNQIRGGRQIIL